MMDSRKRQDKDPGPPHDDTLADWAAIISRMGGQRGGMFTIGGLDLDDLNAVRAALRRELHHATETFLRIPAENTGSRDSADAYRKRLVRLVNRM